MTAPSWSGTLSRLMAGEALDAETSAWAMNEIMAGDATSAQIAAFAVLLHAKGETPDELSGLAHTMLERATRVPVDGHAVDIVGTGGDLAHTVNITSMAAIVVAGTGRQVVKHGNRSASSLCGAADVFEELGVAIDLDAAGVAATAAQVGIGFCFASLFHVGLRHAGPARREVGVATCFNLLGPLTNPARPRSSAAGCADLRAAPTIARVFAGRGDTALVFRGDDGLDELTTTTTSRLWIASGGSVAETTIDPRSLGIELAAPRALRGGDRGFNSGVVRELLAAKPGPVRDAVVLNAAAAIVAYDHVDADASRLLESLDSLLLAGMDEARAAIDSGAGARVLDRWVDASQAARST
jgi:anthranilate phosphoribosyltransferase